MNFVKIKKINKSQKQCYDITVENNHNFFANDCLIHNCDYRNSVGVILANFGKVPFIVKPSTKIAQMIFCNVLKVDFKPSEKLSKTDRDQGGFGSTGV